MLCTTLLQVHPDTNGVHKKESQDATTLGWSRSMWVVIVGLALPCLALPTYLPRQGYCV